MGAAVRAPPAKPAVEDPLAVPGCDQSPKENHCRPIGAMSKGKRSVGRDESGIGEDLRQGLCERDQIVAIGTDAVQQHDQLLGRRAARRAVPRSFQLVETLRHNLTFRTGSSI